MGNGFDIAAKDYDQDFTNSGIGTLQRKQVYQYLNKYVFHKKRLNLLEVNCGTGEDALWFAQQGHNVMATDASGEMISVAKTKNDLQNVEFQQLKIQELNQLETEGSFDLIFSNFGGLNCLGNDGFSDFLKQSKRLLKTDGKLILVLMPKNCLWDNFYLFLKGKWNHLGRRNTAEAISINVYGQKVNTWYYNPKDILSLDNRFKCADYKPIGFFVPPSYTESFFKNKEVLLNCLGWLDKYTTRLSFLSRFSDHYIIYLKV